MADKTSKPTPTNAERAEALVNVLGARVDGEFTIDGLALSDVAEEFGSPCFVYSAGDVLGQVERLRTSLGDPTEIYYSLKANPSLGVGQLLATAGVGAEIASIGELHVAIAAGFAPERIIFAGPGKTDAELRASVELGIKAVHVESESELARLAVIAQEMGRRIGVGLRINPSLQVKGAKMRMGGGPMQFGIDEEKISAVVTRFADHEWVDIHGIHVYVGTQLFDVESLATHLEHVVELAASVADSLGRPLRTIDFGGGFGVPYFAGTDDFDLDAFAIRYREIIERLHDDPRVADAVPIIELGRYIVATAGVYLTKVLDKKESRGSTFVITDGGMNHHITATGNFGQVFRKTYPMTVAKLVDGDVQPQSIVGPCCTPLDVLGSNVDMPDLNVGDLVVVFYSGAYGYSASSLSFLSHPTPAEVMIHDGRSHLLRAAGRPDAYLDGQMGIDKPQLT